MSPEFTKSSAMELVARKLSEMPIYPGDMLVINEEKTIDTEFGWIFFYNSKKFLETKNPIYRVAGNGPIFVNRETASVKFYGSDKPLESLLSDYERTL
jgi:hypothetical protein